MLLSEAVAAVALEDTTIITIIGIIIITTIRDRHLRGLMGVVALVDGQEQRTETRQVPLNCITVKL